MSKFKLFLWIIFISYKKLTAVTKTKRERWAVKVHNSSLRLLLGQFFFIFPVYFSYRWLVFSSKNISFFGGSIALESCFSLWLFINFFFCFCQLLYTKMWQTVFCKALECYTCVSLVFFQWHQQVRLFHLCFKCIE